MLDSWAIYRLKNLARWRTYHAIGRVAWALFKAQNRLFEWRTENDRVVEAKLWR